MMMAIIPREREVHTHTHTAQTDPVFHPFICSPAHTLLLSFPETLRQCLPSSRFIYNPFPTNNSIWSLGLCSCDSAWKLKTTLENLGLHLTYHLLHKLFLLPFCFSFPLHGPGQVDHKEGIHLLSYECSSRETDFLQNRARE